MQIFENVIKNLIYGVTVFQTSRGDHLHDIVFHT